MRVFAFLAQVALILISVGFGAWAAVRSDGDARDVEGLVLLGLAGTCAVLSFVPGAYCRSAIVDGMVDRKREGG